MGLYHWLVHSDRAGRKLAGETGRPSHDAQYPKPDGANANARTGARRRFAYCHLRSLINYTGFPDRCDRVHHSISGHTISYRSGLGKWFKSRVGINQFYQQNSHTTFEQTDTFQQADPWDAIVEGEIVEEDDDEDDDYIEGEIVSN